ncbi:hypothetical protein SCHPADRAFT_320048 [Schizopora paradoxa]|uniref:Transmembrane protein n=1 Tax=Schizopora paradoxa TaxID=27342 RepID=A0A0H2RQU6_9AGAM|nr:hypothetical protein SCHPADRAFT_320048 [Schizopora paradoxa]
MSEEPWRSETSFRSRPKQDNESEKGRYAPVTPRSMPEAPQKSGRFSGLLLMVALLILGTLLMVAHHLFYKHLNLKSIDADADELPTVLQSQGNVNFIGTTIAHGARIALAMAIGVAFAQLFWEVLRSGSHSIAQIDALVSVGQSPYQPSAFRAVRTSFSLFLISVIASATALVVVLSPGALTVSPDFERTRACTVPSIPQDVMKPDYVFDVDDAQYPFDSVFVDLLSTNSYFTPFAGDRNAICGGNGLSCSYNLSFLGAAVDCVDVTSQTNFTNGPFDPTENQPTSNDADVLIYSGDLFINDIIGVNVTINDLVKGTLQVAMCTAYNATYEVGLQGNPPTIQVFNVTRDAIVVFDNDTSFISTYTNRALEGLTGTVFGGPGGFTTIGASEASAPMVSSFFAATADGNHTFTTSPEQFVTTYIQNATLSLLSGNIPYNRSFDTASNLEDVNTTCSTLVNVYIYSSTRLLATYLAALGLTTLVVVYGSWLVLRNGREEKLVFSDVVGIALNDELFGLNGGLQEQSRVYLVGTERAQGQLLPASSEGGGLGKSQETMGALKQGSRFATTSNPSSILTVGKMALLILGTLLCMILQHLYYHYLNGKTPTSSLSASNSSNWKLDQTIVSDIGIALSYIAQVLLAVALSGTCVQLLWHTFRKRGHTIAQIDALMKAHNNPFSPPVFKALGASISVVLVALLAASTTVVSIFTPGSIKVSPTHSQTSDCSVQSPRNLSALTVTDSTSEVNYLSQLGGMFSAGSYLPPVVACDVGNNSLCSYNLQFTAPGFVCENVTASSNYTAFANARNLNTTGTINLFQAAIAPQINNLSMQVNVQTWDVKQAIYQSVNCTGVSRSYSVSLSQGPTTPASINVLDAQVTSPLLGNISQPSTFDVNYLGNILTALAELRFTIQNGATPEGMMQPNGAPVDTTAAVNFVGGSIGSYQLDGNITWRDNMSLALESFAQNASLSIFSGLIFNFNDNDRSVLQNSTTSCSYTFTAYEYTPFRLFVTYGFAIGVTALCVIWGAIAIGQNHVAEVMDFSRILRSVLNERLYMAKEVLSDETRLKADESPEGNFYPSLT